MVPLPYQTAGSRPTRLPYHAENTGGPGHHANQSIGNSMIDTIRLFALRPFALLFRRGPAYPAVLLVLLLLAYFSKYSNRLPTDNVRTESGLLNKSWTIPVWTTRVEEADIDLYRRDGRVLVLPASNTTTVKGKKHPIPALMKEAKKRWQDLLNRQNKTFDEAVKEYKRRYGRSPPKGFDEWYTWAKVNNVQLVDEYDLIEHDLHTYRAFSPKSFRTRIEYCEQYFTFGWRLVIRDGKISREGESKDHGRAHVMQRLIEPFATYLPDMSMWVRGHDTAAIWRSWEESDRLNELVRQGKYDDDEDGAKIEQKSNHLTHPHHFIATCPPGSAMRKQGFEFGKGRKDPSAPFEKPALPDESLATFVGLDLRRYMDVCESPQYRHTHSGTSWTWPLPGPNCAIMTAGVHANFGDVRTLIPEQRFDKNPTDTPWEQRKPTLVYRGQTSGPVWTKEWPWRMSHRARMHLLSHHQAGVRTVLLADPTNEDMVTEKEYTNSMLNAAYLDIGMVGPPVQCSQEDGTCDEMYEVFNGFAERMSLEEQDKYKYALDIDGNSWSGRFKRLMASNAMVMKATVFTEPWADWSIPWLHYVPLQVDYQDMWNILAFFRGDPENGDGAHDDMAKEIAIAGREWQEEYYRWEDLQSYQFRLLLEWGRLYNDGDMDYRGSDAQKK